MHIQDFEHLPLISSRESLAELCAWSSLIPRAISPLPISSWRMVCACGHSRSYLLQSAVAKKAAKKDGGICVGIAVSTIAGHARHKKNILTW